MTSVGTLLLLKIIMDFPDHHIPFAHQTVRKILLITYCFPSTGVGASGETSGG